MCCSSKSTDRHLIKQSIEIGHTLVGSLIKLNRENAHFPVPVRAWELSLVERVRSSRPASACPFSKLRLDLVLAYGIPPDFRSRLCYGYLVQVVCVCVCFLPIHSGHQWTNQPGHTGGRSHRIYHPPSFCGACLNFSREKDSAIPFPRRP